MSNVKVKSFKGDQDEAIKEVTFVTSGKTEFVRLGIKVLFNQSIKCSDASGSLSSDWSD